MASFLDRLFSREVKESAVGSVLVLNPGQARWGMANNRKFAVEAYQRNVVAYQAINRIADAVASVDWQVWQGDDMLTEHPLYALLARPNPLQSGDELMRAKVGYLMIAGNGYDEKVKINGGEVRELYTHRPDRMKIITSNTGIPSGYEYTANSRKIRFDCDPMTGESDIRHIKLFHPTDDWYGLSPIEAGAYAVDQHTEAMTWMQALLQNSARPSGAISTEGGTLDPESFNRLKEQIDKQYSGGENAGRPMLLEGGMKWEAMGLSPTDMSIIESKSASARDVCLAFGVPPQLLGIPGDNTYSNYQEARLAFWEDTVIPLISHFVAEWNAWLVPDFGDNIELRPCLDKIPAIADKRASLWNMADKSNDLTLNERRKLKGMEEIEGGDVIVLSDAGATNLRGIAQMVADGLLPTDTAKALAKASFPSLPDDQIAAIVDPAEGFAPIIDFTSIPDDDEDS